MVVAEVCSSMKYPKRCQYKHAKQKKYHVRNWAEYNEGLRRRGDLTVWFDEEAIANWKAVAPASILSLSGGLFSRHPHGPVSARSPIGRKRGTRKSRLETKTALLHRSG